MKAIQHHLYGIQVTFATLFKGQLLIYFLPGVIVGIFFLGLFFATHSLDQSADSLTNVWLIGDYLAEGAHGFFSLLQSFLYEFFKFLVLSLLSPFNCRLSERFDTQLTRRTFPAGFGRVMSDLLRAMLVALLALIMEFFFMGAWWIISWITGLSVLDPVVYFCITSLFFGFFLYDYSLERNGIGTLSSLRFALSHKAHMIITGALFTVLFMIPFLGIIIAPVLMTMISTATYLQMRGEIPPATV